MGPSDPYLIVQLATHGKADHTFPILQMIGPGRGD
jgi:hypothetical protein